MTSATNLWFSAGPAGGKVSALFQRPASATWLLVLAHGAGAGMTHPFLENLAGELANVGIATLRYQFPYMERHGRFPDPPAVLAATVRAAVHAATEHAPDLPLLAGGKSLGARMSSLAASEQPLERARGLVFFGFPLHPPNQPGTKRAQHLQHVTVPMLFLQGTRDALAKLELLRPICADLGAKATLHEIGSADHSFHVLKSSGKSDPQIVKDLASTVISWANTTLA
jgi:predicted alpha/beta-hydrolase family hydrolase